jgi:hypothetical protein
MRLHTLLPRGHEVQARARQVSCADGWRARTCVQNAELAG